MKRKEYEMKGENKELHTRHINPSSVWTINVLAFVFCSRVFCFCFEGGYENVHARDNYVRGKKSMIYNKIKEKTEVTI